MAARNLAAVLALAGLVAATGLLAVSVPAHEGPPFPIIVDAPAGPWLVSVWTDPDVGIAVFYVILEPAGGRRGEPAGSPPAAGESAVRLGVAPVSGRLPEVIHPAALESSRQGRRYFAEIPLDREELWRVKTYVDTGGSEHVLAAEVEATPDGKPGPVAAIVTLVPFVALGLLWLRAALWRRRHRAPGAGAGLDVGSGAGSGASSDVGRDAVGAATPTAGQPAGDPPAGR